MNSIPLIIMAAGVSSRMKKSSITKNMTKKQINQSNSRVKGYIQVAEGKEPLIFYLIKMILKYLYLLYLVLNMIIIIQILIEI